MCTASPPETPDTIFSVRLRASRGRVGAVHEGPVGAEAVEVEVVGMEVVRCSVEVMPPRCRVQSPRHIGESPETTLDLADLRTPGDHRCAPARRGDTITG
ncbi:hypothetical protein GCM10028783_14260 [Modestobacter muralis]